MRESTVGGRVVGADLERAGDRLQLRGHWRRRRSGGGMMGGGNFEL